MVQAAKQDSLLEELYRLPLELQHQLRTLVHRLAVAGNAPPGGLLRFAIDNPLDPGLRKQRLQGLKLPDGTPAEAVLEKIRSLVADGQMKGACTVAVDGALRFPEHPQIQAAKRILASDGKPILKPGNERTTTAEFDWLRSPPDWARGKWVALLGKEAVASADTLVELAEILKPMSLPQKPLVHRIE